MSTKLERVLAIDAEICRGRYPSVNDLCQQFEIAERTLHEDIRYLKENLAREIEFDRARNGYYNSNAAKKLPEFELSSGELFALTLGKELLSLYIGTSFESTLRSALEKVCERLPDKVRVMPEDVTSIVHFHSGQIVPVSGKLFLDLRKACDSSSQVEITYYAASTGDTTTRIVDPQIVLHQAGNWYLIAYCNLRQALRLFALHRIRDYKLLNNSGRSIARDDLDAWIYSAFQLEHGEKIFQVKIEFAPHAARYIRERTWHSQQSLEDLDDGSCILSFPASSLEEVHRWIAPYGDDALIIEPPELRDFVVANLERSLARYSSRFVRS
ncbi:MAG TPA: WYL domain-containing protein [Oculatellaceae cyanobacterium]